MANATRAPKQWCLTKHETVNSFETWRQNLIYTLSLDPNFAPYLVDGVQWTKKTRADQYRGFQNDPNTVDEALRKTRAQKASMLELIANFALSLHATPLLSHQLPSVAFGKLFDYTMAFRTQVLT